MVAEIERQLIIRACEGEAPVRDTIGIGHQRETRHGERIAGPLRRAAQEIDAVQRQSQQ
jgi:hypothetical protein